MHRPLTSLIVVGALAAYRPGGLFDRIGSMLSLAGIPPMVGFMAKFYVFSAVVKAGLIPLAISAPLTSSRTISRLR